MFDYGDRTGYEPISDTDRKEFHEQGFLLLRNVLTEDHRAALEAAVDRVYAEEQAKGTTKKDGTLHLLGFLERDELFGELLTHPIAFPYMWGLAGWNIYTHHNHLDVTPPPPSRRSRTGVGTRTGTGRTPTRRRWTQTCPGRCSR